MQVQQIQDRPIIATPDLTQSDEVIRLILKLRWIGLDDEADRLQNVVRQSFVPETRATALAEPTCTD